MCSKKKENRINEIIETTLKNVNELIDVNTVIGKTIETEGGDIIIPISKVTIAIMIGGGEYGKVSIFNSDGTLPYSAGNGALISLKPNGFLIKSPNGEFNLLSCNNSPYEKLIDKASEIINNINKENNQ